MSEKIHEINKSFDFSELGAEKEIAKGLKVRIVGIKYFAQDKEKNKITFSRSEKDIDLEDW